MVVGNATAKDGLNETTLRTIAAKLRAAYDLFRATGAKHGGILVDLKIQDGALVSGDVIFREHMKFTTG